MEHEWIIDVIADLQRYAHKHELSQLETQLERTSALARVEINRMIESSFLPNQGDNPGTQQFLTISGAGGRA
ncbi:hypothetical protein SAMN04488005_2289 [Yoonia tamlensis]|uniref:Uncharacterized protein n=1 Tax=Yoonia tamlensis TaxID=390270 RepID=A0A1I6GX94_9RHOB|nr:hypothetical protein [Yoonia tamlensis]SFR46776.1 hypothetical protein SAMN04488005_2289 [Yoonia tamlensis]